MQQHVRTILCVDDDEDDLSLVKEAIELSDATFEVVQVNSGYKALDYLYKAKQHQELPCLILLDMNMPGMDGRTTLKKIKEDPILKDLQLIVFTTSSAATDQLFCAHYGVNMITKPPNYREVQEVIKKVLSYC